MKKKECFLTVEISGKVALVSTTTCPSVKVGNEMVKRLNKQYATEKKEKKFKLSVHRLPEEKEFYEQLIKENSINNLNSFCNYFNCFI